MAIEVTPTFARNVRTLLKRYRSLRQDLQPILEQLEQGERPGDRLQGLSFSVFKLRLKNSDIAKGKSASYRLIYYAELADQIILLMIYSKSDRTDVSSQEILEILNELDLP